MNVIHRGRLRDDIIAEFDTPRSQKRQKTIVEIVIGNIRRSYSPEPVAWLKELAKLSVSEYFSQLKEAREDDYERMQRKHDEQLRLNREELDEFAEELDEFADLQSDLLDASWKLLQRYQLKDNYRITQEGLKAFTEAMKKSDPSSRRRMLRKLEHDFSIYPPYWFYRAEASMKSGDIGEAVNSFAKFKEVWRPVLRRDPYMAEAVKYRIEELIDGNLTQEKAEEIKECLAVVSANIRLDDWENNIFIGMVYLYLGMKDEAEECIMCNIDFGFGVEASKKIVAYMNGEGLEHPKQEAEQPKPDAVQPEPDVEQPKPDTVQPAQEVQTLHEVEPASTQDKMKKSIIVIVAPILVLLLFILIGAFLRPNETSSSDTTESEPITDAKAQYDEGKIYFNRGDNSEAARWYRKAAEQGYAIAQFNLGIMYELGKGVKQDYEEAVKWYRLAAEQGHAAAQNSLGYMYSNGKGVTQDKSEAVKWYRLAAEQGHAQAQFNLGYMYDFGKGVKENDEEAVKWYRLAAEQGHAQAQFNLGYMYYYSEGVKQDYEEALKWYRKSAEQGNADAQCNLGYMYSNGKGVTQDKSEAVKWYRLAAEQGHAQAQFNLGFMYKDGKGVNRDDNEAFKWFSKSANQGHARAQNKLGDMYYYGKGTPQDRTEAIKWYKKAAQQGNTDAQATLKQLGETW